METCSPQLKILVGISYSDALFHLSLFLMMFLMLHRLHTLLITDYVTYSLTVTNLQLYKNCIFIALYVSAGSVRR
jgi:hypothetical protein